VIKQIPPEKITSKHLDEISRATRLDRMQVYPVELQVLALKGQVGFYEIQLDGTECLVVARVQPRTAANYPVLLVCYLAGSGVLSHPKEVLEELKGLASSLGCVGIEAEVTNPKLLKVMHEIGFQTFSVITFLGVS
jgi:hypothetical protein